MPEFVDAFRESPHGDATQVIDRVALERLITELAGRGPRGGAPAVRELGAFSIEAEIGRGAMGAVYRATHRRLGRAVALKLLPEAAAAAPSARDRFLLEARALARVDHPNVVRVFDVLEVDGTLAIAMELVDGLSLADLVAGLRRAQEQHGRKPDLGTVAEVLGTAPDALHADRYATWVARLGRDLARALDAVHHKELVHRDVKPSNVLVDRRGVAHLADFGIVRDGEASGTLTASFVGTAQYAAPEQIRGEDPIDARSDVYSLGATLYELLSLQPPAGGSITEILDTVTRQRVVPLERVANGIPRDLATVVARAIDPDPRRRYPTAAAFADDLQAFLERRPVTARRASAAARVLRWAAREPAQAIASAAVVALVVVGAYALTAWQLTETVRRAQVEAEVRRLVALGFLLLDESPLAGGAVESFERAHALDPDSPEALFGLVVAQAERFRRADALRLLRGREDMVRRHPALRRLLDVELLIYRIDPTVDVFAQPLGPSVSPLEAFMAGIVNVRHALGAERTDLWRRAAWNLRIANQLDPGSELYQTELAQAAAAAGEREELDVQRLALERNFPGSWTAAYRLARSYVEIDHELALAKCDEARALGGDPRLCDILEVRIRHKAGDVEGALARIDRVLAEHPDEARALGLGYIYRRAVDPGGAETLAFYERATAGLRARIDAMAATPSDPDVTWHIALLELGRYRLSDLVRAWGDAVARRDETAVAAATADLEAYAAGMLGVARDAVRRAPDAAAAHAAIGLWLSETRPQQALELRNLLVRARRGRVPDQRVDAARRAYLDALAEARRHFEDAIALAPYRVGITRDYARFLLLHDDEPEATVELVRRHVVLDPENWSNRQVLGSTLLALGRLEEALEWLDRALADVPAAERHLPLASRGQALLGLGRHQEAEADLREALAILEERGDRPRTLCRVLTTLAQAVLRGSDAPQRIDDARQLAGQALAIHGGNPESVAVLAEAAFAAGELDSGDAHAAKAQLRFEHTRDMEISDGARKRIAALAARTAEGLAAARRDALRRAGGDEAVQVSGGR